MDRIEHGAAVEAEPGLDESFGAVAEFTSSRAVVEFILVLVLVVVLAAATSVLLVPA